MTFTSVILWTMYVETQPTLVSRKDFGTGTPLSCRVSSIKGPTSLGERLPLLINVNLSELYFHIKWSLNILFVTIDFISNILMFCPV